MKILVVDDHVLIREAMRGVFRELKGEAAVILEATDSRQAMRQIEQNPDLELVLLDLGLPDRDGLEMLSDLGNRYPTISVVVLSAQQDRDTVMKALDLGALGFIPKSGQREVMLSAFNLIFSGGVYIPPEILNRREPAAAARAAPAPAKAGASAADLGLTERQMQVLELHRSGHCRHCPRPRGGPGRPIDNARGCALRAHPQPTEAWGRFGKVQHAADSLRAAWRNWFGGCGMKPGCPLFTLDACRHGGMTELEEAELTDGQGRALSAHKSRAYEGYAKRTMERALAATRKRHAHRITASSNAQGTEFRNEAQNEFRNAEAGSNGATK